MSRRSAAFALVASAGAIFAGCASNSPTHPGAAKPTTHHDHATAGTATTTTTAPTTAPTAVTTTTTPSGASTTTSAAPPTTAIATGPCDRMSASVGQSTGAAGTIVGTIKVTNTGSQSCTATGYPMMTLYNSGGAPLNETIVKGLSVSFTPPAANAPPAAVTIGPSGSAQFAYQFSDVVNGPGASCPMSASATVTIPGATKASSSVPLAISPCGTIRVSPMFSG